MKSTPTRRRAPAPSLCPNPTTLAGLVAELFGGRPLPKPRRASADETDFLLREVFAGADVIGFGGGRVHMLVTLERQAFDRMCEHGAATGDMEPSDDDEPSIGAAGMDAPNADQRRWADGDRSDREEQCDDEGVDSDSEPEYGIRPAPAGIGHANMKEPGWQPTPLEFAAIDPVTGKRGKWTMFPKEGGR
jgi:hypothetical protein